MNINSIKGYIEKTWDDSVIPALKECIKIPALSPIFNKEWESSGLLLEITTLARNWCLDLGLKNTNIQIINNKNRTPALLIEVGAYQTTDTDSILIYGHLDKQPESVGWDENKGPWTPVIEDDKLYGRGGADDCYAVFMAMTAIKALQTNDIPHKKCVLLIETAEESGSFDLEHYLDTYQDAFAQTGLIICLDSGCKDFERLWLTTSLRGAVVGQLKIQILKENIHSGNSGMVASSFRILRQLLDRIEDAKTGEIRIEEFHTQIPTHRLEQIKKTEKLLKQAAADAIPLVQGARLAYENPFEQIISYTWKPALSYTAIEGMPSFSQAGNVIRPTTNILLSLRIPPNLNPENAVKKLKTVLENEPPYGARVSLENLGYLPGWDMPQMPLWLDEKIGQAATDFFNHPLAYSGEGGSIPFMSLLAKKFPKAHFMVTGILGPRSNAHGPNEFIHIPYAKKLTCAISQIIRA